MLKEWKKYRKIAVQEMRPYVPGEESPGISVNKEDFPEVGGMIARNPDNYEDQWYVSREFFEKSYVLDQQPVNEGLSKIENINCLQEFQKLKNAIRMGRKDGRQQAIEKALQELEKVIVSGRIKRWFSKWRR